MTPEELYRKYRGKKASEFVDGDHVSGIVVGYTISDDSYKLIMALTNDDFNRGWDSTYLGDEDFIFSMFSNPDGYRYINEVNVVKWKFGH